MAFLRQHREPWKMLALLMQMGLSLYLGLGASFGLAMPSPTEPLTLRSGSKYLRFPVNWELLRSGFNAQDVALESETYAEYWAIYYENPLSIYLLTPRGMSRVVGLYSSPMVPYEVPDILAIREIELSKLLGIAAEPLSPVDKSLLIFLPIGESLEQTIVLKSSLKYFVSIQLSMSF